jgi:very-short-patch-repair endonuclease
MTNYNAYNSKLKKYARQHRNNSTKAEIKLWTELLKGKQFHGLSFKRQRPIDNYIADFVCIPIKLIIEVDGISHTWENALEYDAKRTRILNSLGFTVFRLDDSDVLNHLDKVYDWLTDWLIEKGHIASPFSSSNTSPLFPLPRGKV